MDKTAAILAFDSVAELATALAISRQAIYKWPDKLPTRIADRVIAAAVRCGSDVPQEWIANDQRPTREAA
jgi:hypothetical protein